MIKLDDSEALFVCGLLYTALAQVRYVVHQVQGTDLGGAYIYVEPPMDDGSIEFAEYLLDRLKEGIKDKQL